MTAEILLPIIPNLALPMPFKDPFCRALTGPLLTTIVLKIVKWCPTPIKNFSSTQKKYYMLLLFAEFLFFTMRCSQLG
jgi:hypothetical protein